jgi:PAS domain S-box-containing protein
VVIVYLDLNSYLVQHQDPAHPWPRELHAKLVRRLKAAGAHAVVFDIVFTGPGPDPAADETFANALHENGRVTLAAEYSDKATHITSDAETGARLSRLQPPFEPLTRAAASWGVAALGVEDDFVVRRYRSTPPDAQQPSLSWAAAKLMNLPVTQLPSAAKTAQRHWLRYYGPPITIPHVGFTEAMDGAAVPDEFFRDKIVFVGARPMIELFHERQDEFRSPFHPWGHRDLFMPGVEIHATEMLNLVRQDWLERFSQPVEAVLLLLSALCFAGGLVWLRPIPATLLALCGAVSVLLLSCYGFSRGVWFPWLIVSAAQIPAALGGSVLFYSIEWYRTRRRLEAAKQEAERKIREQAALIEKAHDAILVQDLAGNIIYANPSAERLYGWRLAELNANGIAEELFSPDAAAAASARETALARGEWNGELRQQTRAGQVLVVEGRCTLIRDENGQPKELLLINRDITEKKQLEAQFLRTQRMNTIGTLAGGMAHDLNNALAPILMGVQLLRRKSKDEESRRVLGLMETNTHRSADMVRQVLLFARGRGAEFERLELRPLVKELETIVRETFPKNVAVQTFLPDDLWLVRGNPTQLHQVFLNLCVNARDAMPEGGQLSFAADNVELDAAAAAALPEGRAGEYVSILVSDTGTGMSSEVRAHIFEPFFTTKGEGRGTGIGLATVLRIIRAHDAFLRVESQPGQGTTFEIFLPRARETVPTAAPASPSDIPHGNGELILVVDDEQAIRDLVTDGLISHGYRVLSATNGQEALHTLAQDPKAVSALLTDFAMPVMDGQQTITAARRLRPDLPIILASGESKIENGHRGGSVLLLSKPFSLEELLAALHRILPRKPQKRAG